MKVTEIAFTGYPVTDLKRARRFYEGVLGLIPSYQVGTEETGWVEYEIGGAALSIGNGNPDWKPSSGGGSVALEVENLQTALSELAAQGHPTIVGPIETPVCFIAVVLDPDGNSVTIHKRKASSCSK